MDDERKRKVDFEVWYTLHTNDMFRDFYNDRGTITAPRKAKTAKGFISIVGKALGACAAKSLLTNYMDEEVPNSTRRLSDDAIARWEGSFYSDEDPEITIKIISFRDETDDEYERRAATNEKRLVSAEKRKKAKKERDKAKDLRLLEKLKKKYD